MGLSQEELGEKLGVSRQTVSKWENGTAYPDMLNLITISEFFGITIDELIKGGKAKQPKEGKVENTEIAAPPHDNHYEYKSKASIRGVPLVHVNCGMGKYSAKGIIAIGNISTGIISIGLIAKGAFSIGLLSLGLFAVGVLSLAIFSLGCIAAGIFAVAGTAIGVFTLGGLAIGVVSIGGCSLATHIAVGGYSVAPVSVGFIAKGEYTLVIQEIGGLANISASEVEALARERFPDISNILLWWATILFG